MRDAREPPAARCGGGRASGAHSWGVESSFPLQFSCILPTTVPEASPRPVRHLRQPASLRSRPSACHSPMGHLISLVFAGLAQTDRPFSDLEPWKVEESEWWPPPWARPWSAQCIPHGKTGPKMAAVGFICASLLFGALLGPIGTRATGRSLVSHIVDLEGGIFEPL